MWNTDVSNDNLVTHKVEIDLNVLVEPGWWISKQH
jgi:hypothetical protein